MESDIIMKMVGLVLEITLREVVILFALMVHDELFLFFKG